MSSNDGTLSVTLNVDKSTAVKAAWWLVALLVSIFAVLLAVVFFLGKSHSAFEAASKEMRLKTNALDEKRLENRQAWKQLGVNGLALEDHDISDFLKQLREKYPAKATSDESP